MSFRFKCILLSTSAVLSLMSSPPPVAAQEQVTLPALDVARARPAKRRQAAPAAQGAPADAEPPSDVTPPGTLPIVTDQFGTVTVVPNEELRRSPAATLGDLLFSKPGITGSGFAPGASSRPIVRGLDVNRVGIVENGVSGG